jgi:hypothetical protein
MFNLSRLYLNKQRQCQLSKTLARTVALIFWIRGLVVRTRSVAMGSNNNSNVLRHKLNNNNNDNHLSSQITTKSLITWRSSLLNKNAFWTKLLEENNLLKQI